MYEYLDSIAAKKHSSTCHKSGFAGAGFSRQHQQAAGYVLDSIDGIFLQRFSPNIGVKKRVHVRLV